MLPRPKMSINAIIIHCAATPNGRFHTIKDIDSWHGPGRIEQKKRPFKRFSGFIKKHQPHLKHVGYHYVIRTDGVLECGRSLAEVGAHARGFNARSIGICLIGTDKFTQAQWTSLKSLVLTLQQSLPKLNQVIGHLDVASYKMCPCFDVKQWVKECYNPRPIYVLKNA